MQDFKKKKILTKRINFRSRTFDIMMRPDADESVVAEVFKWQEYRSAEDIIKNNSLPILDVGAHIGIFSLYAKAINASSEIYALEPEKENFALLKKNIDLNRLGGIKTFKLALAKKTGTRTLAVSEDSINHHLLDTEKGKRDASGKSEEVSSISLKDFLGKNGIFQVGLLKMDIEGGEYEVLRSLSEGDFPRIGNIILEYHDSTEKNHREMESILRSSGFGVQIFPSGFEKDLGFILARNKRIKNL